MAAKQAERSGLRQRWLAGERLVGTFVKTAHHQVVEILARTPLDFIILDSEHAPFDSASLDACLLAARALGLPALVRVPDAAPHALLAALDMGANGVVVPHVRTAAIATEVAASARYRGGSRGLSYAQRASDYGDLELAAYLTAADSSTLLIGQIEDASALAHLEAICAVSGIDGFLIGRADLMLSMGAASLEAPPVVAAVERICAAARAAQRPFGVFLPTLQSADVARFTALGASLFLIGSDQSLLKTAARTLAQTFHSGAR